MPAVNLRQASRIYRSRRLTETRKAHQGKTFGGRNLSYHHASIGLDIEAETPEEIAVSIMAEVIREKNTRGKNSGYPAEILDAILQPNGKKALMTIIAKNGSAPRCEGAKMLLLENGTQIGTIGRGSWRREYCRKPAGF